VSILLVLFYIGTIIPVGIIYCKYQPKQRMDSHSGQREYRSISAWSSSFLLNLASRFSDRYWVVYLRRYICVVGFTSSILL